MYLSILTKKGAENGVYGFLSARELFDAAREAARECERIRGMLRRMEDAETGGGGTSYGNKVTTTANADPMRRTDARMDAEARYAPIIEEHERLMDYATSVCYGREQDGQGGVCAVLGTAYADVLQFHYLFMETWERTGEVVGYSESSCKRLRNVAFDTIDALGEKIIDGMGMAEE